MTRLDLRGLSVERVTARIRECGLHAIEATSASRDITSLWKPCGGHVQVFCVWLNDRLSHMAELVLWDGRVVCPMPGQDLHGFVRADGMVEWGLATTMDLMR